MNPTALAAAVVVCSVIFWLIALLTLNRGPDRIQLATLCLFFCLIGYGLSVVGAAERGGLSGYLVLLGAYMLVVYVAMGAFAIYFFRWAWVVVVAAFVIHLVLSFPLALPAFATGMPGIAAWAQWVALGAVGLWASMHKGSRSTLVPPR